MARKIEGDPTKLSPYRIEWRPDLTTHWVLVEQLDRHPGNLEAFVKAQEGWSWSGQWRVVMQHVTEAVGLGA